MDKYNNLKNLFSFHSNQLSIKIENNEQKVLHAKDDLQQLIFSSLKDFSLDLLAIKSNGDQIVLSRRMSHNMENISRNTGFTIKTSIKDENLLY